MSQEEEFKPFIAPSASVPELTIVPVITGALLGIVFGASSLYLALKVGMTVSASIPVAVLSITLFRLFSRMFGLRRATILENNIVQTAGSAGESIAFGIVATMPALLLMGFDMELPRIMAVACLGGVLGVLMMIPLRYAMMVKAHKELTYPEGTACAEVLIVGEKGGTSALTVFAGFFFGAIYKTLNVGLKLWNDVPERALNFFKGASISGELSPELLGVGYIIGPRIACIMVGGGILASWVLAPMIKLFGNGLTEPLFPGTTLISQMGPDDLRTYIKYIGAGAVTAGGIISMARSLPTIGHSALAGLRGLRGSSSGEGVKRTERDVSLKIVLVGILALVVALCLVPSLHLNLVGAVLIVIAGFLFVTVSSRLTGEIGSSSNPISGMTVATLLFTSLIFLMLGWTDVYARVTALSVAAVVCVASSNGGTTSQDLKTGFLVGATPRSQQVALLVGVLSSAVVIGFTLNLLNDAGTVYSQRAVPAGARVDNVTDLTKMEALSGAAAAKDHNLYHVLYVHERASSGPLAELEPGKYLVDDSGAVRYLVDPGIYGRLIYRDEDYNKEGKVPPETPKLARFHPPQGELMYVIIKGILSRKLPWGLVLIGVSIALVLELCGVSSLPFAVGVYLPLSTSTAVFAGGATRWIVTYFDKRRKRAKQSSLAEEETSPAILYSSGLIAGGTIGATVLAMMALKEGLPEKLLWSNFSVLANSKLLRAITESDLTSVIAFAIMVAALLYVGMRKAPSLDANARSS